MLVISIGTYYSYRLVKRIKEAIYNELDAMDRITTTTTTTSTDVPLIKQSVNKKSVAKSVRPPVNHELAIMKNALRRILKESFVLIGFGSLYVAGAVISVIIDNVRTIFYIYQLCEAVN